MKRQPVWRVTVATTASAEAAVGDLLTDIFGTQASTHFDLLKRTTTVSVFPGAPLLGLGSKRVSLAAGLRKLAKLGVDAAPARVQVRKLPPEDWAESWKRHFKPIEIGKALLIKPSWSRRKPRKGQALMMLDPGLSFGTGQHATTAFCLRELVAHRQPNAKQSFLDVGTGSGILALAAVKLGYAPVDAFDFDPDAVRVARANARRNHVHQRLRLRCRDVTKLTSVQSSQYDLVCANLIASLLITERVRIANLVKPGGVLVLAGILSPEFKSVKSAYASLGLRLAASKREREWRSGSFRRPPPPRSAGRRAASVTRGSSRAGG